MKSTNFNPKRGLIIVISKIWGRGESKELLLAVDTGSASTVVAPDVIEEVGYTPRDGIKFTSVRINGLIGLSFLRRFDYEIRSIVGRIHVRPAATDPRPS